MRDHRPARRSILVERLNLAIERYPLTTSFWYLYHRAVLIGGVWCFLSLCDVHLPHELGAAFIIVGSLRNFKIPVVLAASAALVKVRPELAELRLAALLARPLQAVWESFGGRRDASSPTVPPPPSIFTKLKGYLFPSRAGVGSHAVSLVDRFGLAYILAARAVAAVSLASVAAALHWGVDFAALLEWLGLSMQQQVQGSGATGVVAEAWWTAADGLTRWAASGLTLNIVYPWVLRWSVAEWALVVGPRCVDWGGLICLRTSPSEHRPPQPCLRIETSIAALFGGGPHQQGKGQEQALQQPLVAPSVEPTSHGSVGDPRSGAGVTAMPTQAKEAQSSSDGPGDGGPPARGTPG